METAQILVAEDNPINQKVAEMMLKKLGYAVALADNGKQAVEKIQKQPFRLVLMDAQMPVMDGFEATRWIRENLPPENQPSRLIIPSPIPISNNNTV